MADARLQRLAARGQSIWIDNLSRSLVHSGELERLIANDAVTGITSNPTIFQKAISGSSDYDAQIKECETESLDPREVFFRLAVDDIRDACDVLRPVWERTGGDDGYVSLEVEPGLAHDTGGTVEQAVDLHARVDRPNAYIKIPATLAGLPAIEECIARGIPINITLIFSVERYDAVVDAYLSGLERFDGDRAALHSVASLFVSRLDTEVDRRLEATGGAELQGKLGIANAKVVYRHFRQAFGGSRWEALAASGATRQKPLWASTSTKNPAYRDVMYVEELIGPETVNTMPPETLEAFADHGEVRGDTVLEGVDEADGLFDAVRAAGVDLEDVMATLEAAGVQKFADSFDELLAGIRAKQSELSAAA